MKIKNKKTLANQLIVGTGMGVLLNNLLQKSLTQSCMGFVYIEAKSQKEKFNKVKY